MFRKIIILSFFCVLIQDAYCNANPPNDNGRIVGGYRIRIEDAPYQVALYLGGSLCGGSIIGRNKILTAAHCVRGRSASQIVVLAGTENRYSGGVRLRVNRISIHPNYNSRNNDNDVAVLTTSTSFTFSSKIAAIELLSSRPATRTEAKVSGWGTTRYGASYVEQYLREVRVPIVDQNTCRSRYGSYLTDRMICAGLSTGGKDSCQGE